MSRLSSISAADFRRLLTLSRDLLQTHDLKSVQSLVGETIHELLVADGALIVVMMGMTEHVIKFNQNGLSQSLDGYSALYEYLLHTTNEQMPHVISRLDAESSALTGKLLSAGIASLMVESFPPIKPIGVLAVVWNSPRVEYQLTKDTSILRYIAELMGAAFGNIEYRTTLEGRIQTQTKELAETVQEHAMEILRRDGVEEEVRHISEIDVLTGVRNRRGFFIKAEQCFHLAQLKNTPCAFIFADIDGLKRINDTLGHEVGDQLIRESAWVLQKSLRANDVVARLGGDEFAAFTLDTAEPEVILARIQENIELSNRQTHHPFQMSFSTGIVRCDPSLNLSLSDYLALADSQMYAHKKHRCNKR